MIVRPLAHEEIALLENMPPPEWQLDIVAYLKHHFPEPYFRAFAAAEGKAILGLGQVVLHAESAWLGNIIVREDVRGRGIGQALTAALCDFCKSRGRRSIQLIATELGRPVYEKLGFRASENYLFTKGGHIETAPDEARIFRLKPENWPQALALDREATGEDRRLILEKHAAEGHIWRDGGRIEGFYLPNCGDGLIVARPVRAGLELLHFKHFRRPGLTANLPEANAPALAWLQGKGFEIVRKAPRMFLGEDVLRRPDMIFSRVGGYLG